MNPSQHPSALRSKKEIMDTLLTLMHHYPYSEITIKHVLLESGISRKTFYRNFSSKEDVLIAYLDFMMAKYVERIILLEDDKILSIFDVVFDFCNTYKEILLILRDNQLLNLLLKRWNLNLPILHEKVIQGQKDFVSVGEYRQEYILAFNVGAIWNVVTKWLENDMKDPPEILKKIFLDYLFNIYKLNLSDI